MIPSWTRRHARVVVVAAVMALTGTVSTAERRATNVAAVHPHELAEARRLVRNLQARGDLRPAETSADPIVPGRRHHRLVQYHQGVPLLGGDVTVQTDGNHVVSIFGRIHEVAPLGLQPNLSAHDAVTAARGASTVATARPPRLAIVTEPLSDSPRLAYLVETFGPDGLVLRAIDADSGAVVFARQRLPTQGTFSTCADCAVGEGRGVKGDRKKISVRAADAAFRAEDGLRPSPVATFDMRGNWNRTLEVLVDDAPLLERELATDSDNVWGDGPSVDAHVGTGWTLDYLAQRFGHQGIDGRRRPVSLLVHPVSRADYFAVPAEIVSLLHLNAFFCDSCGPHGVLVFGEGLPPGQTLDGMGQTVDYFSAGLDVVAHEVGHAVIDFSSRLIYRGESGALSEAFADMLGVGTEFFVSETGRHPAERADYLVGEDVVRPGGIRSLSQPRALGDPDHYALRFLGDADNGGVHTNSTIVSHVYYLTIEGGTNRTSNLSVLGLGTGARPLVEQIFFRAFTRLLPSDATFSLARAATLQSARDLSSDATVVRTLAAAWTAVGVE